jgi:Mn-dependent DtxR family transcriptional regulator
MVSAKTNLSKSSVFIYVNKLNKDGLVIVDKSKRPFKIIAV